MNASLLSSVDMGWQTPQSELAYVRRVGPIGLDPCTTRDNPVGAPSYFALPNDGLILEWTGLGLVFVNPPYGRELPAWINKCTISAEAGVEIIALVPARTDTRWWHGMTPDAICFRKGRIRFVGAPSSAPFPSAYVYWGQNPSEFKDVFIDIGQVF